jgi:hypothetical protein
LDFDAFQTENLHSISPENHAHAPGSSRPKMLNVLTFLGDISPSFDPHPQTKEQDLMLNITEIQVNIQSMSTLNCALTSEQHPNIIACFQGP